jgi:hypothetical protein
MNGEAGEEHKASRGKGIISTFEHRFDDSHKNKFEVFSRSIKNPLWIFMTKTTK